MTRPVERLGRRFIMAAMRTRIRLTSIHAVVVALALTVLAPPRSAPEASPVLLRLRGIQEVKGWFNAYKGHPRLILLLSPT